MALFQHNPDEDHKGRISYNRGIVSDIIRTAIEELDGVELTSQKKGIRLDFGKTGIYVQVSVIADYGYSIPDLSFKVQQSIKHNVEAMTKYAITQVDVSVVGVDQIRSAHA